MSDFVVVGGGFAGLSAAAHLSAHGSVILFEMESSLAYHTSGRSAAMLVENYGSAGSRPLVRAARPFLENPPEGSVDVPLLSPRAVMWVANESGVDSIREKETKGRENGAICRLLDPTEVLDLMPAMRREWVAAGLYEPSGADIDVAALHQAFVRIARGNGADIRASTPVENVKALHPGWRVTAGGAAVDTDVVVNAAGAWGDVVARLAGVEAIGLQPLRRTAFMVPGLVDSSAWPMVVETDEQWYLRPDGIQFLCSLAEETPSAPMDTRPRMEDVALAIERINAATNLDIRTVNSQWTGLRTFAPDRDLVIGEDPIAPGFYWLVGQGGIGVQTSPAYGSLLASLATGSDVPDDLAQFGVEPSRTSPARFR